MKKRVVLLLICICISLSPVGCASKYNDKDFLGKTSAEIIDEYGPFDCTTMPADGDGLYRKCRCGYTIKEASKSFLGTNEEILFFIIFDENGIAAECEKAPRPGG